MHSIPYFPDIPTGFSQLIHPDRHVCNRLLVSRQSVACLHSSPVTALQVLTVISEHLQIDSALLGHPDVVEAVSFGAPDEKYGEIVAAAVVLAKPASDPAALIADIKRVASQKLAPFKVCPTTCIHASLCSSYFKSRGEHCMKLCGISATEA